MKSILENYKKELESELENILCYWKNFALDKRNGGFVGQLDNDNQADFEAPKGSVLNARILWSFSAAHNLKSNSAYLAIADRAFQYLLDFFIDKEYGGVYWLLDAQGKPVDTTKKIYALAFTIYAFSEYHIASKHELAKEKAIEIYKDLVSHSYDLAQEGYFEAFTREWGPLADLRLSEKDANEKKTMNTHLHILEAFTTLYRIWPNAGLRLQIISLLNNFETYILNKKTGNLILFFDENWMARSSVVSYGHDIEASWLLLEAAEAVHDEKLIKSIQSTSVKMAAVTRKGLDMDGGLWYENESSHLNKEKHWWVQAEAMVGFFNAWQISEDKIYLDLSLKSWAFVKKKIIDHNNGEWFWGVTGRGEIMSGQDKVGVWKCPYHNSRACIELIKRIRS